VLILRLWLFVLSVGCSSLFAQTPDQVKSFTFTFDDDNAGYPAAMPKMTDGSQPSGTWTYNSLSTSQRVEITNSTGSAKTYKVLATATSGHNCFWIRWLWEGIFFTGSTVSANNGAVAAFQNSTTTIGVRSDGVDYWKNPASLDNQLITVEYRVYDVTGGGERWLGLFHALYTLDRVTTGSPNISNPSTMSVTDTGQTIVSTVDKDYDLTFYNTTGSTKTVEIHRTGDPNSTLIESFNVVAGSSSFAGTWSLPPASVIQVKPLVDSLRTILTETGNTGTGLYRLDAEWLPLPSESQTKTLNVTANLSLSEPAIVQLKDDQQVVLGTWNFPAGVYSLAFPATVTTEGTNLFLSHNMGADGSFSGVTLSLASSTVSFTLTDLDPPEELGDDVISSSVQGGGSTQPNTSQQFNTVTTTANTNPTTGGTDIQTTSNGSLVPGSGVSLGPAAASDPEAFLKSLDGAMGAMSAQKPLLEDDTESISLDNINSKVRSLTSGGKMTLPTPVSIPSIGQVAEVRYDMPGLIPDFVVDMDQPAVPIIRTILLFGITVCFLYGTYRVSSI